MPKTRACKDCNKEIKYHGNSNYEDRLCTDCFDKFINNRLTSCKNKHKDEFRRIEKIKKGWRVKK